MNLFKIKLLILGFLVIILSNSFGIFALNENQNYYSNYKVQENQLVIYTYESLLADPFYDFVGNFSVYSGISKNQISVNRFDDANEIVSRLLVEQADPQADVVIGIDNALIHFIEDKSSVLQQYSPSNISHIDQNLIRNLDPEKYLIPYDYGLISFYYQNQVINTSTHPILENLTLDKLLQSDLLEKLIVENPQFSSTGLGFLLWTISVYGDPSIGFEGLLGLDWRNWWKTVNNSITITDSWGAAFEVFFDPEENKPIMVSYGTSPSYSYCLFDNYNSTSALLSYEANQRNGWLQIEGIGLVKKAPNEENAKKFIDWFISPQLQSNIPTHQWMYPSNTQATLPQCFEESAINPSDVNHLNDLIPPQMLKNNLDTWLDAWEQAIVAPSIPSFEVIPTSIGILLFGTVVAIRRKKQLHR
jgi:thiamine transport system substrate-binding protein